MAAFVGEGEGELEAEVADEPDGEVLAGVEVEAGEAVELVQDVLAERLGVVEDGDDAGTDCDTIVAECLQACGPQQL
ncbi:MAG: hypothetical protein JNL82_21645 [Myxococcales bacterium]|nr:hypothetical protein [Myxococcales bacterium]